MQVFRQLPYRFRIIDGDEIWSVEFFLHAQRLTKAMGNEHLFLAVLDPDPETYYYAHFKKYPVFKFGLTDSEGSYLRAIDEDPGGSPADAIAYNSAVVLVYPDDFDWVLYGDRRGMELGVLAAMNEKALRAITFIYPSSKLHSATTAITQLLPPVYRGRVPEEVCRALVENYEK